MFEIQGVRAGYGRAEVLHGVDLAVADGAVSAVLGPNGAGKSTLLRVAAGLLPAWGGRILLDGHDLTGHRPEELARCGVYLVPEAQKIFPNLTVRENLRMATGRPERQWGTAMDEALDMFPVLAQRMGQAGGTLSGGEQQMVSLARAFIARPRLLLLDEPSLGLAPILIDAVFDTVRTFRERGTSIVIVEQYVHRALALADDVVVLNKGVATRSGRAGTLDAELLARHYLHAPGSVSPVPG